MAGLRVHIFLSLLKLESMNRGRASNAFTILNCLDGSRPDNLDSVNNAVLTIVHDGVKAFAQSQNERVCSSGLAGIPVQGIDLYLVLRFLFCLRRSTSFTLGSTTNMTNVSSQRTLATSLLNKISTSPPLMASARRKFSSINSPSTKPRIKGLREKPSFRRQ